MILLNRIDSFKSNVIFVGIMSNTLKIYRTKAFFTKGKKKIPFTFECKAHSEEDALERIFNEIGSRHSVKRENIFIPKDGGISEISLEEAKSSLFSDILEPDFEITKQ